MNREQFLGIAGGTIIAAVTTAYLLSDKSNLSRADINPADDRTLYLRSVNDAAMNPTKPIDFIKTIP